MVIGAKHILAGAMAGLLLGCGGGGSSASNGTTPATAPSPTATPAPASNLPVIKQFSPASSGSALNQGNQLNWEVSGATSLSIDQGIGTVTGTKLDIHPSAVGTVEYSLTAKNDNGTSTAKTKVVTWPATVGLNADRPPFQSEKLGGVVQAWAGGGYWPEQLFWQDVAFYKDHRNDAVANADGWESGGYTPAIGCVSWGFDLTCANGGDVANGFADFSQKDGFKQYGAWMNPRAADYFALNEQGKIAYPGEGYISFGMPMLPADAEFSGQTFGQWAGKRLGGLALDIHCRALIGADGFIGLDYFTDWHPRLIAAFEQWSGQTVQGVTVADKHAWIMKNCATQWWDFQAHNQSSFFTTFAHTLLDQGKEPRVGGQWPPIPGIARFFGDDPRIWAQHLDPKYLLFYVEVQSAGDRNTPPQWTAVALLGATASRSPEVPIGAYLDADIQDYWGAVDRVGLTHDQGLKFLKHEWLSAAWAHLANNDGSVRRATQMMVRSYWDAGGVDPDVVQTYLAHIPRHPFGPAIYYSVNIEKSYENVVPNQLSSYPHYDELMGAIRTPGATDDPRYIGVNQGLNLGYWVSDAADVSKLDAADKPSAWLVYNLDRLPAAEKAMLLAIAPVIDPLVDPASTLAAGPVRTTGSGLNCLAFVDQNGSVIVLVSNINSADTTGTLSFTNVGDGSFACTGLLGTPNGQLTIANHAGSLPITVAGRDSIIFEIKGLKWLGH